MIYPQIFVREQYIYRNKKTLNLIQYATYFLNKQEKKRLSLDIHTYDKIL